MKRHATMRTISNSNRANRLGTILLLLFLVACVPPSESSVATSDIDDTNINVEDAAAVDTEEDAADEIDATLTNNNNPPTANNNGDVKEETFAAAQETILLNTSSSSSTHENNDANNNELQYAPPTHFEITAHIQTNLHTGHSYFLSKESLPKSFAHLPFLECGAVGSTTEGLPLVSGVFRHAPHAAAEGLPEQRADVMLENLEGVVEMDKQKKNEEYGGAKGGDEDAVATADLDGADIILDEEKSSNGKTNDGSDDEDDDDHPKRPTPPKYVVALSPMEITVGGNGNETRRFDAGDVIFIEDTWWGVWDDDDDELDDNGESNENGDTVLDDANEALSTERKEPKMKGYIMRASPESSVDLNVLMLTVPNAIHRRWKNAQYARAMAERDMEEAQRQRQQKEQSASAAAAITPPSRTSNSVDNGGIGTRRPWWKSPTTFLHKHGSSSSNHRQQVIDSSSTLPTPCSLESDPAFANPATFSTSLSQHFAQHFTNLLRRVSNPHPSFLPHHHQELFLPIVAQTGAALIGGAASLALVLQLWRILPGPMAVRFGAGCLLGLGTWGFVRLGEEALDEVDDWRERRRLERMMSEGWGRGGGGGDGGSALDAKDGRD